MKAFAATAVLLLSAGAAHAVPITYSVSTTNVRVIINGGSQQVGSLTLAELANTTNVATVASTVVNPGTVTFSFTPNVGGSTVTGTFTDAMEAFLQSTPSPTQVGFTDTTLVETVLGVQSTFASTILTTGLTATGGHPPLVTEAVAFPTVAGSLEIDNWSADIPVTVFTASLTATPEPTSAALLAVGLLGAGGAVRRRRS